MTPQLEAAIAAIQPLLPTERLELLQILLQTTFKTVENPKNLIADYWLQEDSIEDFLAFLRQRRQIPSSPVIDTEQARKNQTAIDLLDSWLGDTEDPAEHQQAWDFLKTALDQDRLSDRPLFL